MTSSERRSGGVLCAVMPIDCAHDVGERGPAPAQAPSDGAPGGVELNGERGLFMGPLFTVLSAVGFTIASVNGAWRGQLLSALVFAVALVVTVVTRRRHRADLVLWRDGLVCEGEVVEAQTWSGGSTRTTYTVEYRYPLPAGVFQNRRSTWTLWDQKRI